jgi:peptidoglycan/LPS O-acetylase OafA/YrhL
MIFPWLAYFICQKKTRAIIIYLFFIITAYYSIMYLLPRKNPLYPGAVVPHNINATYDYGFLRGLSGFMIGMIINSLYQSQGWKKAFSSDLIAMLLLLCATAALHYALNDLIAILFFAMMVLSFASNQSLIHRICQNRVLQFFGNISYSIYLMQIFFQTPFSHGYRLPGTTGLGRGKLNIEFWPGLLYCGIYLLLLIGLATLTYNTIEKPFRKLINQNWG